LIKLISSSESVSKGGIGGVGEEFRVAVVVLPVSMASSSEPLKVVAGVASISIFSSVAVASVLMD
jgi:hypothetical protein